MLTPNQIEFLQRYIREIEESPTHNGMIFVSIKNGHVRDIYPCGHDYFPKP